jgi:GNAT superfamily N-acetyltransferase
MSIRPADRADIPRLLEFGPAMHAESPFWSRLPFSASQLVETLELLIGHELGFVWVAERNGVVVGVLLGSCEDYWMSSARVAMERALYVEPAARGGLYAARLVTAFVAWANEYGAALIFAGVSTGVHTERTVGLYERLGFVRNGAVALERVG